MSVGNENEWIVFFSLTFKVVFFAFSFGLLMMVQCAKDRLLNSKYLFDCDELGRQKVNVFFLSLIFNEKKEINK
jgi:hypothetical protein